MTSFLDGISDYAQKNPQLVAQGLNALGSFMALQRKSPNPNYHGNIMQQGLQNAGSMFLRNAQFQNQRDTKQNALAENLRRYKLGRSDAADTAAATKSYRDATFEQRATSETAATARHGQTQNRMITNAREARASQEQMTTERIAGRAALNASKQKGLSLRQKMDLAAKDARQIAGFESKTEAQKKQIEATAENLVYQQASIAERQQIGVAATTTLQKGRQEHAVGMQSSLFGQQDALSTQRIEDTGARQEDRQQHDINMFGLRDTAKITAQDNQFGHQTKMMREKEAGALKRAKIRGGRTQYDSAISKKSVGKLEDRLVNANESLERLAEIKAAYKPEFQQIAGRFQALKSSVLSKAGFTLSPEDDQQLRQFSGHKRATFAALNQYIKDLTGAQLSKHEAKRLMRGMPNPGTGLFDGDSPPEFESKFNGTVASLRKAAVRQYYALKNGIDPKSISLPKMEKIMRQSQSKIIAEETKANPDITDDELIVILQNRLGQEFGLTF